MSQTSDSLKICIVRIKCGQSFTKAVQDLSFPIEDLRTRQFAQGLFQKILSQSLPALNSIEALREHLLLIERSRKLLHSKTFMPKMQCKILGVLGFLLVMSCSLLMPREFRPSLLHATASSSLIAIALLLSFKMSKALEKHFWFSNWIQLLSFWQTQLSCGQTILTAYRNTQPFITELPKEIQDQCRILFEAFANGQQILDIAQANRSSKAPMFTREAKEQLRLVVEQAVRGESISEILVEFNADNQNQFLLFINEESERTQLKMMIPLLGLFLPAFWIIVFGPLISHLLQASR